MRITNSMVTANTKANININKYNSDKLNTMTASGQKITRPSDDPVIAIRALRLNTSISELAQFSDKNIPDADAWYRNTEDALVQADTVLESMRQCLNQAVSQENTIQSVQDILEELKQLKTQYYAIGNADSAGRTVFTGFRTSEMLTFTTDEIKKYEITENLSIKDVELADYIAGTKYVDRNSDYIDSYKEVDVTKQQYYRLKLSYSDIAAINKPSDIAVESIAGKSPEDIDAIYTGASEMTLIKETGELIIPKTVYEGLKSGEDTLEITYTKSNWKNGDLRPEHYFMCKTPEETSEIYKDGIEYNFNRVDADGNPTTDTSFDPTGFKEQNIAYEIAFNQTIEINTHASDAFSHDIGRDIEELIDIAQKVLDSEKKITAIEGMKTDGLLSDVDKYNAMMNAAKKENVLYNEKMHNLFQTAVGSFKGYSDKLNNQISKIGAMTARLELTKNRVKDQKLNVKELADENINADLTETALDYKNAMNALEAARLAAGKIADSTLLNFI